MVSRIRLSTTALAFAASVGACKDKVATTDAGPPPAPVDQLAPNEAVEGQEKAFALALPRVAVVTSRFDTSVYLRSQLNPEDLANYVRARVKDGKVVAGGASTTFEGVVVPSEPQRKLTIEIRRATRVGDARSEMLVRDTTPPPVEPGLSDEERWKKAGFDEHGRQLDPKHTQ